MNKVIRDFAIQAGAVPGPGYVTDPATGNSIWTEGARLHTTDLDVEKFAALLISEASAVAWFAEQYNIGMPTPASLQIKEKFGVE